MRGKLFVIAAMMLSAGAHAQTPATRPADAYTTDSVRALLGLGDDEPFVPLSERRTIETRANVTVTAEDGTPLPGRYGAPRDASLPDTVLMLHDAKGSPADLEELGGRLIAAGYAVMAATIRPGSEQSDASAAIAWLERFGVPGSGKLFLLGVGEGARAAAEVTAVQVAKVEGAVYLGPPPAQGVMGDAVESGAPRRMLAIADATDQAEIKNARDLQIRHIGVIVTVQGVEEGTTLATSESTANRVIKFLKTGL